MAKDVRTAAEMGAAHHVDAPLSVLLSDRWALAVERLGAARDFSAAALSWDGAYRVDRRTKP
jgi:hypothetical protein